MVNLPQIIFTLAKPQYNLWVAVHYYYLVVGLIIASCILWKNMLLTSNAGASYP